MGLTSPYLGFIRVRSLRGPFRVHGLTCWGYVHWAPWADEWTMITLMYHGEPTLPRPRGTKPNWDSFFFADIIEKCRGTQGTGYSGKAKDERPSARKYLNWCTPFQCVNQRYSDIKCICHALYNGQITWKQMVKTFRSRHDRVRFF